MNSQNTSSGASFVPEIDPSQQTGFIPLEQARKLDELDGQYKTTYQPKFYPETPVDQYVVQPNEEVINYPYNEVIATDFQPEQVNPGDTPSQNNYIYDEFNQNLSSLDTSVESEQLYTPEQVGDMSYTGPVLPLVSTTSTLVTLFPWLLALLGVISLVVALVWGILYPGLAKSENLIQNSCGVNTTISYSNNTIICETEGKVTQVTTSGEVTTVEKTQAITGAIIFSPKNSLSMSKAVYSNQNSESKPGGITVFTTKKNEDLVQKMIINNLFLFSGTDKQNEVNVTYVTNFLNKASEFSAIEPLGNESVVLRAFQLEKNPQKSKTLGEIENLTNTGYDKIRAVYGVDGEGVNKKQLTVRVMVAKRDNVALLTSTFSKETQVKVDSKLTKCSTTTKFGSDFDKCIQEALKDDGLSSEGEKIANELLSTFSAE
jgi:hypothetical protein